MQEIEGSSPAKTRQSPVATIIVVLCIIVVAVVGWVLFSRLGHHDQASQQMQLQALSGDAQHFLTTAAEATFNGPLPPAWDKIGALPLEVTKGLHAAGEPAGGAVQGGGVVSHDSFPADQEFSIEATLAVSPSGSDETVQLFVSADRHFSPDKGIDGRELVWQLRGDQAQIIVNGTVAVSQIVVAPTPALTVRIVVGRDVAFIESFGQDKKARRLWEGAHQLGETARSAGIRMIQGAPSTQPVVVSSLRINRR